MLITWLETFARLPRFFRGSSLLVGFLSGLIFLCAVTPLRLWLGFSHEVDAALILTAGVAFCLVERLGQRFVQRPQVARLALLTAALWTWLVPTLVRLLTRSIGFVSLSMLEWPGVSFVLFQMACLLTLFPVLAAVSLSYQQLREQERTNGISWLAGLALSLLTLPTLVLPFMGIWWLTWLAIAGCGITLLSGMRGVRQCEDSATPVTDCSPSPLSSQLLASVAAMGIGGLMAIAFFIAIQLIPRNLIAEGALLAGFVLGLSLASFRHWLRGGLNSSLPMICLGIAAWGAMLAAGYPLWTLCCLKINAWVSQLGLIVFYRSALLAGLVLPVGYLAGRLHQTSRTSSSSTSVPFWMAAGFAVMPLLPISPWVMAAGLVTNFLLLGLSATFLQKERFSIGRLRQWGFGLTAGVAVLGLTVVKNLNPATSERMLFNAASLQSFRQGIAPRQLSWIDDSRQLADFTTLRNHVSLWRQRGSQVLLRQNGMILGLHSSDARQCPHNAGDLLPALLPLAIHPDPEHVLVLGIHPPTLLACHAWPLRSVHCIDGAAESHRMLNWLTSSAAGGLQFSNGPEFRFHHTDPVLSLSTRHAEKYDLITCPIVHPGTPDSLSQLTREFYLQARACLSNDGIFSQRLPYYDLGPDIVKQVVGTLQSVFGEVRAIESIPGELIFVCSTRQLPPIDESFVERLKSPQIRTLLAESGWDWSLILGRGGVDDGHLRELCDQKVAVNTCVNSPFAYWLPMEVACWGRKGDATRLVLAKYGDALRTPLGESTSGKEVTERLEDLNLAHQIQRDHPNDPWAYRAALKSRLQNRPRATIMQVNHQLKRVLDPEDQRRKDYLLALGPAAKNPRPSPEVIEELAAFDAPFDPLVSLFVYSETANMFHRCDPPQTSRQLQHLLHTVYFSSGYDQSVRNVADAIEILCRNPETAVSEAARWDEINSLMQTLAQRWQMRLGGQKLSKYELSDTEKSLEAVEAGMAELEKNFAVAGLTKLDWSMRKQTLEQALIRPLRQHRSIQAREVTLAPPVANKTRSQVDLQRSLDFDSAASPANPASTAGGNAATPVQR